MSFILDALRKAERDRNLGRTPSLGDVTATAPRKPSQRPSPRTLGLIALVAGLLIVTVWLWPRHPPGTAPPPMAEAPPAAVAAPPAPSIEAEPAQLMKPADEPAPPAPEIATAVPAEATLSPDVPAESIDDLMAEPEPEPAAAIADEVPPPEVAASEPASAPAGDALEADPAPTPEEVPPPAEPAVASDAPLLRDMPSDYRGAFPALRVDVHVYDDDAARRWVMVNGRKAMEGTTLGEGPTVSRITPEGIVFDFRGRSVLFPLNR
ncbi:MAG: hypothetical protein K0Q76_1006 [Panacagrimonas sp.]|nr:general secretion pathway protein GspB [Panacagrimonas sp.]MCC2655898.1 hypothetical protein [Panacagrimonas sp.]